MRRDFQPLRVLVEHRIDDVDERFVAVEQPMPAGEQVTFEPALALVLAQHFHHASAGREEFVVRHGRRIPLALGHLEHRFQAVGERLVRAKHAEISLFAIEFRHVAQERPEYVRVADAGRARRGHDGRVIAKVRHAQITQQRAAVRMGIGAHASRTFGRKLGQLGFQAPVRIEQFLRAITPEPLLQQRQVRRMRVRMQRHLVRTERAFDLNAIDDFWSGPALGRVQHDHRPARTGQVAVLTGIMLERPDPLHRGIQRGCHRLMHQRRLVALDEDRRPAIAAQQLLKFLARDARKHGRVGNLVAVQMQDRQYRAVRGRIEKLVRVPRGGQWSGFRLAVADHAGDDQIGIVEHRAERMAERIAQLAAFMDRSGALRRCVARNPSGKRKLHKQFAQSGFVLADVRIDLAVGALQVGVSDDGRTAVTGTGDVNHVEVVPIDDPVQMGIDEVLSGCRAPVPEQHVLHIRDRQRPPQQRIVVEKDLPDRQIIGGAPIGVQLVQQFRRERWGFHGVRLAL